MSSPAQITANRANAQLSTGPRSVEGKAVSSRNSFKFGITAQSMIIPGEDPAELEQLTAAYQEQFQPVGPIESMVLETVVRSHWFQLRCDRVEAAYYKARIARVLANRNPKDTEDPLGAMLTHDSANGHILHKIFLRRNSALRDWNRAVEQLYCIQAQRQRTENPEPATVTPVPSIRPRPSRVRFNNLLPSAAPPAAKPVPEAEINLALRL